MENKHACHNCIYFKIEPCFDGSAKFLCCACGEELNYKPYEENSCDAYKHISDLTVPNNEERPPQGIKPLSVFIAQRVSDLSNCIDRYSGEIDNPEYRQNIRNMCNEITILCDLIGKVQNQANLSDYEFIYE